MDYPKFKIIVTEVEEWAQKSYPILSPNGHLGKISVAVLKREVTVKQLQRILPRLKSLYEQR